MTVLLEMSILPKAGPVTELTPEAPAGLIRVKVECSNGRMKRVAIHDVPVLAATGCDLARMWT